MPPSSVVGFELFQVLEIRQIPISIRIDVAEDGLERHLADCCSTVIAAVDAGKGVIEEVLVEHFQDRAALELRGIFPDRGTVLPANCVFFGRRGGPFQECHGIGGEGAARPEFVMKMAALKALRGAQGCLHHRDPILDPVGHRGEIDDLGRLMSLAFVTPDLAIRLDPEDIHLGGFARLLVGQQLADVDQAVVAFLGTMADDHLEKRATQVRSGALDA